MGITRDAVKLKDEALFWVYISEWLVVTAAAMVAGVVVWSLMVRRRMYRAVGTTRMRMAD
jgi:dolichyl-phosphate-mannose--protein O-mannosyl transferase